MCETVARRRFQDVNAVYIEIFFPSMRGDLCETVAKNTNHGGNQEDIG